MDKSALIIGVGLTLLGSSFFLTSLILALRKKSKIRRFSKTTGVIVHVETSLGGAPRFFAFAQHTLQTNRAFSDGGWTID